MLVMAKIQHFLSIWRDNDALLSIISIRNGVVSYKIVHKGTCK